VTEKSSATVWAKLENLNPAGSIKERICVGMIEAAEKDNLISPAKTMIVEATNGNTGVGLALICAVKGYRLILTMPEGMSIERRLLLTAYGAELIITPEDEQMYGAIRKAEEIIRENPNAFMPQQYKNPYNPETHRRTTALEILEQLPGEIHSLVVGVGTGGTITGVGEVLRKEFPNIHIVAVEPAESPVLSGGKANVHEIQGIGAGFIPEILNTGIYDEVIQIPGNDAKAFTKQLARREGLLVGISAGAVGLASVNVAKRLGAGKQVVTIFCDSGERYLSLGLFT
jgi:cysteine synthase A